MKDRKDILATNGEIRRIVGGINKPGLLVHGIGTISEDILRKILCEGLKAKNDQSEPRPSYSVLPDCVSFCMVSKLGYEMTSAHFLWGASNARFNATFSLMVDPDYVRNHSDEFIAIGENFAPNSRAREFFSDKKGRIFNGLRYRAMHPEAFADEVITKRIPPEAIIGLVSGNAYLYSAREILRRLDGNGRLTLYTPEGKVQPR